MTTITTPESLRLQRNDRLAMIVALFVAVLAGLNAGPLASRSARSPGLPPSLGHCRRASSSMSHRWRWSDSPAEGEALPVRGTMQSSGIYASAVRRSVATGLVPTCRLERQIECQTAIDVFVPWRLFSVLERGHEADEVVEGEIDFEADPRVGAFAERHRTGKLLLKLTTHLVMTADRHCLRKEGGHFERRGDAREQPKQRSCVQSIRRRFEDLTSCDARKRTHPEPSALGDFCRWRNQRPFASPDDRPVIEVPARLVFERVLPPRDRQAFCVCRSEQIPGRTPKFSESGSAFGLPLAAQVERGRESMQPVSEIAFKNRIVDLDVGGAIEVPICAVREIDPEK